jgi:hypothetical protein
MLFFYMRPANQPTTAGVALCHKKFCVHALDYIIVFLCVCCHSPQMLRVCPINLGNVRLKPQIPLH